MAYAAMDFISLRRRSMNDAALMAELIRLFRSELSAGLARFDALAATRDVESACKLAHRLKGSAATICAPGLTALFEQIEAFCAADAGEAAFAMLPEIQAEAARCIAEIDARPA